MSRSKREELIDKSEAVRQELSAIFQKRIFFERPLDRATSSAPKGRSSVRFSVRVATAHNLSSAHGRAGLNLLPAPDVGKLPDCRPSGHNRRLHFKDSRVKRAKWLPNKLANAS